MRNHGGMTPFLPENKKYGAESFFRPESLLREARRQKKLKCCRIPEICLLDPDGDIIRYLRKKHLLKLNKCWACYHTELYNFRYKGLEFGIIGCVVGAPFAVLVAEELFISGTDLLISMTSAGKTGDFNPGTRFMLIEKAIRDEGTSYHYLRPSLFSCIDEKLLADIKKKLPGLETGITWTTDSPFRETEAAIKFAKNKGALAVEMEAAGLYAFARAKKKKVICVAHLTNNLGREEGDFEKGLENGSIESLEIIYRIVRPLIIKGH